MIKLLEILNDNYYCTVHKGGILLWTIVDNKPSELSNDVVLKTKELKIKLSKDKNLSKLINPLQLYINSYRILKNGNGKYILDNSIATIKDLNPKQMNMFEQFIKNEGYKIENLFKMY